MYRFVLAAVFITLALSKCIYAQVSTVPEITKALEKCKAAGGGIVELTPGGKYELDWGRQFHVPANTFIKGNAATIMPSHLTNGQGTASIFVVNGDNVTFDNLKFDGGKPEFEKFTKTGYFCVDALGRNRLTISKCDAAGVMSLTKFRQGKHLVIRDCIVEESYYGLNFDSATHVRVENLWCYNVIRGLISTGGKDLSLQLTVGHDGKALRLETPVLIKAYPTAAETNAVDTVRIDLTVDGTIWRRDAGGNRIDLFRAVGVEVQSESNALPTSITNVLAKVQFIGEQGQCASVGFGRYIGNTEMPILSPHAINRIAVEGSRYTLSPLINKRSNTAGNTALQIPVVDRSLAF